MTLELVLRTYGVEVAVNRPLSHHVLGTLFYGASLTGSVGRTNMFASSVNKMPVTGVPPKKAPNAGYTHDLDFLLLLARQECTKKSDFFTPLPFLHG